MIAVVAIALIAVVNWKASIVHAKKFTKGITFVWIMYIVFVVGMPSERFLLWLEETEHGLALLMMIMLLQSLLLFIASVYIPHKRSNDSVSELKDTLKHAFILVFCMIALVILFIWMLLQT